MRAMDFAAAGLLDGLDGDARAARLALLEQLTRDGFTLEQLSAAAREDRLTLLGVERLLGGRYTAQEIEAETGVPAAMMLRLWRLAGLPEAQAGDRVFSEADLEAARSTRLFLESGLPLEHLEEARRVLGEAMARVAATVTASFAETFLRPGDSEYEVALRFTRLTELLAPAIAPVLVAAFDAHLRESVQRGVLGSAELAAGQLPAEHELSVCFADLVGFTRLGAELEGRYLGSLAGRFAELAADVALRPVRLVKTIGDAAMLVSPEPEPLVAAALTLLEAADEADLPSLRAGIAAGPTVERAGDFFGHTVNLASRVTGVARPGSVLSTEAVRDATPGAFDWSAAGSFRLKGVAEHVPLFRARRPRGAPGPRQPARTPRAGRRRTRASR
jgi:adenylate cyclase